MKNIFSRLTISLFISAAAAVAFAQDPVLDKKIKDAEAAIAETEKAIKETEDMLNLLKGGRTFVIRQDFEDGSTIWIPVKKEVYIQQLTWNVLSGRLTTDQAVRIAKTAAAVSKAAVGVISDEVKEMQKGLKKQKDEYRTLIDKRQKQNEEATLPNLAGAWESDYYGSWQSTTIAQTGNKLTFTNEKGDSSPGEFVSSTQVKATKWEGGLTATIESPNRIRWSNGCIWRRKGT